MKKNTFLLGGVLYSSHLLLHLVEKHHLSREASYDLIQKATLNLKPGEELKDVILVSKELSQYFTSKDLEKLFSGKKYTEAIQSRFKSYESEIF